MLKSFYTRLELWINIFTMRMSRKTKRLNMLLLDLKGLQHYGGMKCRLSDAAKESRKSKVGIKWLRR
jgi:hypothetical protein